MLISSAPDTTTVVVSTLQGINQQLQTQGQQLSSLTAAITNLSLISSSPPDTVDDDDTDSTGGTNQSLIAYLNAQKRLDFCPGQS